MYSNVIPKDEWQFKKNKTRPISDLIVRSTKTGNRNIIEWGNFEPNNSGISTCQ